MNQPSPNKPMRLLPKYKVTASRSSQQAVVKLFSFNWKIGIVIFVLLAIVMMCITWLPFWLTCYHVKHDIESGKFYQQISLDWITHIDQQKIEMTALPPIGKSYVDSVLKHHRLQANKTKEWVNAFVAMPQESIYQTSLNIWSGQGQFVLTPKKQLFKNEQHQMHIFFRREGLFDWKVSFVELKIVDCEKQKKSCL